MALGSVEVEVFQFILRPLPQLPQRCGWLRFVSSHDCNFRSNSLRRKNCHGKPTRETLKKKNTNYLQSF